MAVVVDSQESGGIAHHSTTTPLTWSFTNTSGNLLIVGVSTNNVVTSGGTPSTASVTYNSVSMSSVPSGSATWDSAHSRLDVFYLVNPATGPNTVSVTFNGTISADCVAAAISYQGVDATTPLGTATSAAPGSVDATATLNVAGTHTGNQVVDFVATGGGVTSATAPTVLSAFANVSQSTAGDNFALGNQPGSGTQTVAWTIIADQWAIVAVEINAAFVRINWVTA